MDIDTIIQSRKTQKVLAPGPWPLPAYREALAETLRDLLSLAAAGPYHKKAHPSHTEGQALDSGLPYRFHILDSANCRRLLDYIVAEDIKSGKVYNMLAAADALLLATWLPEPEPAADETAEAHGAREGEPVPFAGTVRNMEHIAATAAAIQNLLLGATARGIPNYWSSGGQLRLPPLRRYLGVPLSEVLLGAIFLFPPEAEQGEAEVRPGKLRDQGKDPSTWSRWVELGP